jgi:hypothetical protein
MRVIRRRRRRINVAGVKKLSHDERGSNHDNAVSKTRSPAFRACFLDLELTVL